jgi:N-acylglucosamine 2-epimerase
MEQVAPDGAIIDHIDGRTLNPGHAIEGAWFILEEARYRNNDQHLINLGCKILDYMWERDG